MSNGDSRKGGKRGDGAGRGGRGPARGERQVERAQRKMDQARRKIEDAGRSVERELERAERQIDRAERETARATGPIWARPEPGARRARFSRDQIAQAGLAIADKEGFEAVSMRRVAAELDAGTMTLYHYVRTKDELVALMDNAIMGELLIPDGEMPSGWREGLTQIANRTRDTFTRHPWTLEMTDAGIAPNGLRHMEQSFAAVAELDLDFVEKFEIISLVDDFVFGYAIGQRGPGPDNPAARQEWLERAAGYIEEQVATGEFPHLDAILPDEGIGAVWEQLEQASEARFERGLARLLDGIALDLESRGKL